MITNVKQKIQKIMALFVVGLMLFGNVTFALADDVTPTPTETQAQTQSADQNVADTTLSTASTTSDQSTTSVTPTPTDIPVPTLSITPIPMPENPADQLQTKSTQQVVDEIQAQNKAKREAAQAAQEAQKAAIKSTKTATTPSPSQSTPSTSVAPVSDSTAVSPLSSGATITDSPSGAAVVNSGNGQGSTNTSSSSTSNTTNTNQNNSANVNTSLNQSAITGDNTAHDNIGGDTTVKSSDANVSGTAITAVNTNVDNVAVSQFDVNDVQNGDLVLDPVSHCIAGCGSTASNVVINSGNGQDSDNTASSTTDNTDNTFQNNDANVGTDMTLVADSGNNRAHDNIGGDTSVQSGNANVSANAVTLANNNIDGGQVQYYEVNIYGELHGDIILPEEAVTSSNGSATMNTGNGADSTNTASNSSTDTSNTTQSNNANINNNLNLTAGTGNNYASDNGGSAGVESGDTNVVANVLNVANSNIDGGTMWLVIVNEAGKWVGKILGGDGSNMAGSAGTEFVVNPDGSVTATNDANGAGSTNNASNSTSNTENTTQSNTANINNNLNLTANTGDNRSHDNLGGSNTVTSGDATIIANLINFVNNNIKGNGKLVVTVVNVFGQWFGDFVAPGQTKQTAQSQSQQSSSNSGNSNNTQSPVTQTTTAQTQSQTAVLGASNTNTTPAQTTTAGGSTLTVSSNGNPSNVLVAGASTLVKNPAIQNTLTNNIHQISINLAWMLILLPILGIFALGRKIIKNRATA